MSNNETPTPRADAACRKYHGLADLIETSALSDTSYGISLKDAREMERECAELRRELTERQSKILIEAREPEARELLESALKWIRRIEERADALPPGFCDNCDVVPLRRRIEALLEKEPIATSLREELRDAIAARDHNRICVEWLTEERDAALSRERRLREALTAFVDDCYYKSDDHKDITIQEGRDALEFDGRETP